jgi:hypothetical protein
METKRSDQRSEKKKKAKKRKKPFSREVLTNVEIRANLREMVKFLLSLATSFKVLESSDEESRERVVIVVC